MYDITFEKVKDAVIHLANETPDRVYNRSDSPTAICSYISDSPALLSEYGDAVYVDDLGEGRGCIFGRALQNLGVPVSVLHSFEGNNISEVLDYLGCELTPIQSGTLDGAQERQDFGTPWGELVGLLDK